MITSLLFALTTLISNQPIADTPTSIPAFTAYSEPDPGGMNFEDQQPVTGWTKQKDKLAWYGRIGNTGKLDISVTLTAPQQVSATYRLTAGGKSFTFKNSSASDKPVRIPVGTIDIGKPGYQKFTLEGIQTSGKDYGKVHSLDLSGPASEGAFFNLKERRNASSVHFGYPLPPEEQVVAFYNEVTAKEDPIWTYYSVCGFSRGYFGMQVNSPTERRIIFSIWDSGTEAKDRANVAAEDRVQLLAKGDGVFTDSFGNEGTGGHSHLVYSWKKGQTYRFMATAKSDGDHTIYSGYFFFPEKKAWGLIARFRAPKDGKALRGLYSFSENFGGANGQLRRNAEFGNQWVMHADGEWRELTIARFTHDPTGNNDRHDYGAFITKNAFSLWNGGFTEGQSKIGDILTREATHKRPKEAELPQF